jgi:hypothetical protein
MCGTLHWTTGKSKKFERKEGKCSVYVWLGFPVCNLVHKYYMAVISVEQDVKGCIQKFLA